MPSVTLSEPEWQTLVNVLANASAPWVVTNPLLSKISEQLRARLAPATKGDAQEADEADRVGLLLNG